MRENRDLPQNQMQFGIGLGKFKPHPLRIHSHHPLHIGIIKPIQRRRGLVFKQSIEGVHHIFGQNRIAILKTGLGIEGERDRQLVCGQSDVAGKQTIHGKRLIPAFHHQGVKHKIVAQLSQTWQLVAFEQIRIQGIEVAQRAHHQAATFGRIGVGIGKTLFAIAIFGGAAHGQTILGLCTCGPNQGKHTQQCIFTRFENQLV